VLNLPDGTTTCLSGLDRVGVEPYEGSTGLGALAAGKLEW
jgi:hypothetical protein